MAKVDWETIVQEGKKLASLISGGKVDLNEAQKVLEFYVDAKYDDARLREFLDIMLHDPPQRSRKTEMYYQNLTTGLRQWRTNLQGKDKALAWGWAIRIARSEKGDGDDEDGHRDKPPQLADRRVEQRWKPHKITRSSRASR